MKITFFNQISIMPIIHKMSQRKCRLTLSRRCFLFTDGNVYRLVSKISAFNDFK